MKGKAREFLNSGIGRVYLLTTVISAPAIALAIENLGTGIFVAGWVGLFSAIIANEVTEGYLMDDSWITRRKI